MKVVYLEDDLDLSLMVKMALELRDIEVVLVNDHFGTVCDVAFWDGVDIAIIDILLRSPITGIDIIHWLRSFCPWVKRVSYSAVISFNPELHRLADEVVVKGDPRDLFNAMGLPPLPGDDSQPDRR